CVHQHDSIDFVGVLRGIGVSDHQSNVVTNDDLMLIAKRLGQGMNILVHRLLVVTRHRLGRLAEAAQVRRDHCMTLCQLDHQWPPHVTVLSVAMQENYGIAFAGDQIVQSYSVYRREDRKSTRLNSSHVAISYAVFCLKKKK